MESIVHKARNFKDAEEYDIKQHTEMTPYERQAAAKALRERFYGKNLPDVRDVKT